MQGTYLAIILILLTIIAFLSVKIILLHKAAEELREGFEEGIKADSNVGISISTNDRKVKKLAAGMNRQLKLLRKEHLRYIRGDLELKTAITNISHDLRTPLTAICGYMELLSEEELSEQVKEYLAVIGNRVDVLKELTEELFRYSVIMSVEFYKEREEISLNTAIEECVAGYYGALTQAGITPVIDIPKQAVVRKLNRKAVFRIFSNIVSNAVKYSDGDFSITLEENGTIYFSNSAAGLDKVMAGHLFDRFYTVESGRSSTGLGLAIAKTLTEEMHGQIDAGYEDGRLEITVVFAEE